jgi:hypothetical protein
MSSIQIDVYLTYQGRNTLAHSYVVPYDQEDMDHPDFFL